MVGDGRALVDANRRGTLWYHSSMETVLDPRALSLLESGPAAFRALAVEFGPHTGGNPRESWGVKECVAHVFDVSDVCFGRIQRIIEEEDPFIQSIYPAARMVAAGYLSRTLDELVAGFIERRARDVAWLKALPASAFGRAGTHDVVGTLSGADIANYWAFHDLIHLRQAAKAVQDELVDRMGNTRQFIEEV
jgi:hypothetical protein